MNSVVNVLPCYRKDRDAADITKSLHLFVREGEKVISIIALRALHRRYAKCCMVLRRNSLPKRASIGATLLTAGAKAFQDEATGAQELHEVAKNLIMFVRRGHTSMLSAAP